MICGKRCSALNASSRRLVNSYQNSSCVLPFHSHFNLLMLFGCWCYWNNHCSLVVVNNKHFCRVASYIHTQWCLTMLHRQTEQLLFKHGGLASYGHNFQLPHFAAIGVDCFTSLKCVFFTLDESELINPSVGLLTMSLLESLNTTNSNSSIITHDKIP